MGTLRDDLVAAGHELRETHISWVFLSRDEAWKVKKPVDLGFLDFRTLAARRHACDAEVTLNRRLASDVYRGVVPVRRDEDGRHTVGEAGQGAIVDWAVHMVRLPDEARADVRLAAGTLTAADVDRIAERLVMFHQAAETSEAIARFGSEETILANLDENFAQAGALLAHDMGEVAERELERWQREFLMKHRERFSARVAEGRIRDGHGDLRLEHVYFLPDGIRVLDCIEFNERFRYADVAADLAFLSMDLAAHGRIDLAERLLGRYARDSGDFGLYGVVDFYESYRAYVRAKIATFGEASAAADSARTAAAAEARRFGLFALACSRRPLTPPTVIAVGGLIASGKSTMAEHLGASIGAPVIEADRTRKQLLHVPALQAVEEKAWHGAYDPAFTDRVYDEMFRRGDVVLSSGRPVVLDASFRSARLRARARDLAHRHGVPFRFVECVADAATCRARLTERARHESVSDGRLAIFDDFAARWEAVGELRPDEHIVLDTTPPLAQTVVTLARHLAR